LDSTHNPGSSTDANSLPLRFGKAAQGGGAWRPHHQSTIYDGLLDDVAIFKIALSQRQIFNFMFTRLSGMEEGLVGYWGFNEGDGAIAHDAGLHHLHGAVVGSPAWIPVISKPVSDVSDLEK